MKSQVLKIRITSDWNEVLKISRFKGSWEGVILREINAYVAKLQPSIYAVQFKV